MAIPEGSYYNKVVFGGDTLIDLSSDTVEAGKVLTGYTAHDKTGAPITGTCDFDSDTTDANATAAEILSGRTGYVNKNKLTGTMPNNGAVSGTISSAAEEYTVPQGYHDGSGKVSIDATEQAKIIAGNIKKDIVILGVTGSLEGPESVTAQAKTTTPSTSQQVVTPDAGYDYLSQVTVAAIPYVETANAAGGYTATIG